MAKGNIDLFTKTVRTYYKKHGRHHLPWRKTADPYRILISEVMLQQTQVDRVIPYYKNFLKQFPTVAALARAPLGEVLRVWSGLGYNRRAKMLHDAAKKIMIYHNKNFPKTLEELRALPGVGDYTAKAVRVFAFNEPELLIETNVRSVFIHHFFPRSRSVSDEKIFSYMKKIPMLKNQRAWYAALMDYGTYLKKIHGNVSRRSSAYVKQKPLKGSDREIRGALLKTLLQKSETRRALSKLPFDSARIDIQLTALVQEGLVYQEKGRYLVPHSSPRVNKTERKHNTRKNNQTKKRKEILQS